MQCAKSKYKQSFYWNEISKCKHKKNIIRIQNKIMPQTNVKQTQGNGKFYIYLYPFRDITQGRLQ